MLLRTWREEKGFSLARAAAELGVEGRNPAQNLLRWETGESRPDADMVHRIEVRTCGAVTALDMHATRLAFLNDRAGAALELCDAHDASLPERHDVAAEAGRSHVNNAMPALQAGRPS